MFEPLSLTENGCSPWPPALQFTPEVEAGIRAAAALACGESWDMPQDELELEILARDLIRYAPELVRQLMSLAAEKQA